jgi:hypothetical protein
MLIRGKGSRGKAMVRSENAIVRVSVDIGHVAGRLFVCIGVCIGGWFIGIRRLP